MAQHSMSEPDPSKPISSATGVLRARPEDTSFETDFADLAARFAAKSGGGLSAELSADLALEIVLNEVVEQACLATGATGAAIVLMRDGEMVCRASSGSTAPELGVRLDTASGLSGECIRTRRTQRCDDVLADERVDQEASQRLGVRSVMMLPLLRGEELVGVFESFSSLPGAFGERDERTLEALAGRVLNNLERATQPLPQQDQALPVSDGVVSEPLASERHLSDLHLSDAAVSDSLQETVPEIVQDSSRRGFDFVTAVLGLAVLACAVLLGELVGQHLGFQKAVARERRAAPASNANANANSVVETRAPSPASADKEVSTGGPAAPVKTGGGAIAPGSLHVYADGKEVFRMSAAQNETDGAAEQEGGMQRAASLEPEKAASEKVVELSPAAAEGSLLHRVEPQYPEDARQQQIQGPVVLEVHIADNGAVQDVQVVSGAPQLAQASSDAVKQWRFKPRVVNGHPAEMQTKVTLNFRLPK
jgi:TonB family protein